MLGNINKTKLVDFIMSLAEDFEALKDEKTSAYKISEADYREIVMLYMKDLDKYKKRVSKYCCNTYNIFLTLYEFFVDTNGVTDIEDFQEQLWELSDKDFNKIVYCHFSIDADVDTGKDHFSIINSLSINEVDKWNLLTIVQDRKSTIKEMQSLIKELYPIFEKYEELLIGKFEKKALERIEYIENNRAEYNQTILRPFLSKEAIDIKDFEKADEVLLYMNGHTLICEELATKGVIFTGIYLWDMMTREEEDLEAQEELFKRILKSLADPSRLKMLYLIRDGINTNKMLAKELDITPAGVTYQTNILITNNLVMFDRNGKEGQFVINYPRIKKTFEYGLAQFNIE